MGYRLVGETPNFTFHRQMDSTMPNSMIFVFHSMPFEYYGKQTDISHLSVPCMDRGRRGSDCYSSPEGELPFIVLAAKRDGQDHFIRLIGAFIYIHGMIDGWLKLFQSPILMTWKCISDLNDTCWNPANSRPACPQLSPSPTGRT